MKSQLRYIIIGFMLVSVLFSFTLHEYYVSVANANYNPEAGTLEVGMKLFTDDLERTILEVDGKPLKLSDIDEADLADDFFETYLASRFVVLQDGFLHPITFLGSEPGPDETWLYFEIEMPESGPFSFKNTILFDVFPAQINIMHFKVNGQEQSHYFNASQPEINITF